MNPQQLKIIETFGQGQSVVAGAGCGKTTTLVAKCLELLNRNSKARFCAVSFTEKSVRDLKEALTKGLSKEGVSRRLDASHWVKTIHGLCYAILQEFPVSAGLQGGEKILMEDEASRYWERSVQILWTSTDNEEISAALERLLAIYNREQLETLFKKLRSLMSFGVETRVTDEMADLWLVFSSVYSRYQHAKNRDGGLDFNDLELLALKALAVPTVAAYYQARFDLVLVDEFQDTNPIQGAILERFVKPGLSNMCIVGDPKQSIYRFRDADVTVFQDLTERLPSKHLLDTNYRSRPGIIDFVNEVCAPAFEASSLPYEALVAGRTEEMSEEGAQEGAAEVAPSPARVSRLVVDHEQDLANFLKAEAALGVDLSEYVILARSIRKDKIVKYLTAMEQAEVPFLLGSGGRFYSDPRVQELVALLRGWISPKNTLSQAAVLRSPWVGVSDPILLKWAEAAREGSLFEHFFKESRHPVAAALRAMHANPARAIHYRPGQILDALLELENFAEELYLPLVSLWHKAENLSAQGQRFEDVVLYFSNAIENEKIEKDIPAPAERGMVRVLTVHSSKGLQFPRVVLLDFDGEYKSSASSQDLIWDRKKGVHLFRRDEEGKRDKEDFKNIEWVELEKSAQVAESKRVFYVAITRPQEELILVWKREVKKTKASEAPTYNPYLSDNWRAWVEAKVLPAEKPKPDLGGVVTYEAPQALLDLKPAPPRVRDFDPQSYRPRHSPSEWLILNQCELRYHLKFTANPFSVEEDDARLQSDFTDLERTRVDSASVQEQPSRADAEGDVKIAASGTVAEKGERIHAALEFGNWEKLAEEFSPEISAELVSEVKQALERPTSVEVYREFGFEVPLSAQEALVGMMDRLEIDEQAKRIRIVDYKFTAKPKTGEALLANYELQLKLYLWAASKLVNFEPETIEAELMHFTEYEMFSRVPLKLKFENLAEIETRVQSLFAKAKEKSGPPRLGEYCRYCEFVSVCPAQKTN